MSNQYITVRIVYFVTNSIVRCRNSKNIKVKDEVFNQYFGQSYTRVGTVTKVLSESNSIYVDISTGEAQSFYFELGDTLMVRIN